MIFVVTLDFKKFIFNDISAAGNFALVAKHHSANPDLDVKIEVVDQDDDQES